VRARFAAHAEARLSEIGTALGRSGSDVLRLEPGEDAAPALTRFFERRRRRR
jgi:hypothetical protein